MTRKSKSSNRWLERQRKDPYVKKAHRDGLGSRAHFKLEQLDRRFSLINPGIVVLDLGAAPGGWSRYAAKKGAKVYAVDIQDMEVPAGVTFFQADMHADAFVARIDEALGGAGVDLVLSDAAPHISGIRAKDQAESMALVDLATDAAERWLNSGGCLVVKMFQGAGVDEWIRERRSVFSKVTMAKPDASRSGSREVFAVCLEHAPHKS
jgi:23S rRNA (uridine2552-2'-O)-methyltransferase